MAVQPLPVPHPLALVTFHGGEHDARRFCKASDQRDLRPFDSRARGDAPAASAALPGQRPGGSVRIPGTKGTAASGRQFPVRFRGRRKDAAGIYPACRASPGVFCHRSEGRKQSHRQPHLQPVSLFGAGRDPADAPGRDPLLYPQREVLAAGPDDRAAPGGLPDPV